MSFFSKLPNMSQATLVATPTEKTPRTRGVSAMVSTPQRASDVSSPSYHPVIMIKLITTVHIICSRRKKHFKSATTGVATKNMRNELNRLVNTVSDPTTKKVRRQCRFFVYNEMVTPGLPLDI